MYLQKLIQNPVTHLRWRLINYVEKRAAPGGTWVLAIEIPATLYVYGARILNFTLEKLSRTQMFKNKKTIR